MLRGRRLFNRPFTDVFAGVWEPLDIIKSRRTRRQHRQRQRSRRALCIIIVIVAVVVVRSHDSLPARWMTETRRPTLASGAHGLRGHGREQQPWGRTPRANGGGGERVGGRNNNKKGVTRFRTRVCVHMCVYRFVVSVERRAIRSERETFVPPPVKIAV